ncbi:MAG: hypothetical protein LQ338_007210 [Usnochroma carphineum]|nr:MAG: hypothetical protein LQ338_007210 [Usnochroma carphineum]
MAEAAGLVLGAFPVLVLSLSNFAQSLETAKSWRHYRRELKAYARTLDCQRVWYLDTLEELFDGIATTDAEVAELMDHPSELSWKPYEKRLQERLGPAYERYLETIQEMTAALEDFRHRIGIRESGEVEWINSSSIKREMKRLQLVLSKKVYTELLIKIDKANKDLRGFTHQNRFLEPVRHKRRSKFNAAYFKELRMNARSLYNVVVDGGAWNCTYRSQHVANLRLELRHKGLVKTKFRVLLTNGIYQSASSNASSKDIWNWREIDVAPLPGPSVPLVADTAAHTAPASPARAQEASGKSPRPRKKVTWSSSSAHSGTEAPSLSAALTHRPITDLCNAIQPCTANGVIGVLVDDHSNRKHDVHVVGQALPAHHQIDPTSLDSLLKVSHNQFSNFYLSRRDRLRIAAILASSVLQLDTTSWLRPRLRSAHIVFISQDSTTDFSQPYLSSRICADSRATSAEELTPKEAADETAYLIHNDSLFGLGTTLIELAFGKPLAEMQHPQDVQSDDTLTSIKTANRLLDLVYNESGGRYGDVVRRCLHCSFDVKDKTFENDKFQEAVLDSIVTPLMQDLEAFEGCATGEVGSGAFAT